MISDSEFAEVKQNKIKALNSMYPNGFDREWSVYLSFCGTRTFKTVTDKDGKCIDLVEHNDPNIKSIRHMGKFRLIEEREAE